MYQLTYLKNALFFYVLNIFIQSHTWFPGWTWFSQFLSLMYLNKYINKWCQLFWLAANGWIAEDPERWDRTSACKGALLQPLQSMFRSHLAHPEWQRHKSDRPRNRGLRPLLFSNNVTGSFTPPSNWSTRMKETGPTALKSPPNDAIIGSEKGVSQPAWSHRFFKDLVWWSGRGWTHDPPRAQQTGALPTELTGWWLFQIINIDNLKRFKKASNTHVKWD